MVYDLINILHQKYGKLTLNIKEVAMELGVNEQDIKEILDKGTIGSLTIGSKIVIPVTSIVSYLSFDNKEYIKTCNVYLSNSAMQYTVEYVLKEVLEERWKHVSSATKEWQKNNAKEIFNDLGNKLITDIKPKDVQQFLNSKEYRKNGKRSSERFIKGIKEMLGFLFEYAKENDYISKNPMTKNIKLPQYHKCSSDDRFLNLVQINNILNVLSDSKLYSTLVRILILTGMRIGEAVSLYWEDINFAKCTISINKSIHSVYGEDGMRKYEIGKPKTNTSNREIIVNDSVIELLKKWKDYVSSDEKLYSNIIKNNNQHMVFTNKKGQLINYQTLQNNFKEYLRRNGNLDFNVSFHMFRHCYATFSLEGGVPIEDLSKMLGHSSIETTADIYYTLTNKNKKRAVSLTNDVFMQISDII